MQRDQQHRLGAGQETQKQGGAWEIQVIIINSQFESATAPIFIIQTRQVQLSYNICQLIIKKGNIYIDKLMKYIFPLTRYRAEKKWREYI